MIAVKNVTAKLNFRYDLSWPAAATAAASTGPRAKFVQLSRDAPTDDFVERARTTEKMSWVTTQLHRVLRKFRSDFDVNGLLGSYPLHLLSTGQLQALLAGAERGPARFAKALDIGAGVGLVTDQLRPLCDEVVTTETSSGMAKRLREAGYECWEEDVAETVGGRVYSHAGAAEGTETHPTERPRADQDGSFSLVSMLNVIDRSPQPAGLLRAAHRLLHPTKGTFYPEIMELI